MKILIAYAGKTGTAAECAEILRGELRGAEVTVADLTVTHPAPDAIRMREQTGCDGDPDSACFHGQDLVYTAIREQCIELFPECGQKVHVHLVIEKAVDLQYIARIDFSVLAPPRLIGRIFAAS